MLRVPGEHRRCAEDWVCRLEGLLHRDRQLGSSRQARGRDHAVLSVPVSTALLLPYPARVLSDLLVATSVGESVVLVRFLHLCKARLHERALLGRQLGKHGVELPALRTKVGFYGRLVDARVRPLLRIELPDNAIANQIDLVRAAARIELID